MFSSFRDTLYYTAYIQFPASQTIISVSKQRVLIAVNTAVIVHPQIIGPGRDTHRAISQGVRQRFSIVATEHRGLFVWAYNDSRTSDVTHCTALESKFNCVCDGRLCNCGLHLVLHHAVYNGLALRAQF